MNRLETASAASRLLLVEDNEDLLHLTAILLENEGFDVVTATSADEALAVLETRPVDIVFSDVVMPGMSGVELGRLLRDRFPTMVVVLTSGFVGGSNPAQAMEFPLIPKPYQATMVAAVIHQQLHRRRKH